ncbi:MAG: phytoene desaturase family protein [Bacteroidales bacterium]|nr:phytoene desaturase family protein [Bacteroidales bacterium]MDT8432995.1 1-hydroxycarotenoid 3,4-desaturase CrtD [Bacteroidales bacterium]
MKLKISVIGAGIGGLATAIRMALKGHEVTVFEQSAVPGGKMGELRWKNYRWDAGPSLFTLPDLMEELYMLAEEEMKVSVRYTQLEVITKYFYEDGLVLNAYGDPEAFVKEAAEKTSENPGRIRRFLRKARAMYSLTRDVFIFGDFSSPRTFVSRKFLRSAMQIYRLEVLSTMHGANRRRFRSDHLVQLFDRYATYNGSNPYKAPGTLNVISHLEHNLGAYFPEKGMHTLAIELQQLAERVGVKFEFNAPVERIVHQDKRIRGVQVNGETRSADLVVSDVDIYYLYRDLLPDVPFPEKYFKPERSTSAMIFYWAMDRQFPELELHNLFFSRDYRGEFGHLFDTKTITDDPTTYLFISSKIVKSDAPEGGENWFVMINVPENTGQDWDAAIVAVRKNIIAKISRILETDVAPHILHETVRDPRNIEEETFSFRGSLYGNSSNSSMAAFSRHPNHRKDFHGLYFVGGSVHPGGGIPLCLASAKIVDGLIDKKYG